MQSFHHSLIVLMSRGGGWVTFFLGWSDSSLVCDLELLFCFQSFNKMRNLAIYANPVSNWGLLELKLVHSVFRSISMGSWLLNLTS